MQFKSISLRMITLTLLLMSLVILLVPIQSYAYQNEVDWIWHDTKPTSKGGCKKFVVKAGPPKILRGRVSGRTCLTKAIQSYRIGDHEKAFGWVLAGQCHDREAREVLVRNAHNALQYILKQYGPQVTE